MFPEFRFEPGRVTATILLRLTLVIVLFDALSSMILQFTHVVLLCVLSWTFDQEVFEKELTVSAM